MNIRLNYKMIWGLAGICILLLLPVIANEIKIHLAIEIIIYALFAISFNLLAGYGGMLPFGHAALFGVGAYATALLCNRATGIPLLWILVLGGISGSVAAAIVGIFCIRLKGAYFAILSFGFQMFFLAVASKWRDVTNGPDGMGVTRPDLSLPLIGEISLRSINSVYYFTLTIVVIAVIACFFLLKTHFGNSLQCMREKEIRASFLGYNIFLTKFVAFLISGVLAGLAGGLYVLFQKYVNTGVIDMNISMTVLLMVTIGGTGHFLGPVLGAACYVIFQDYISSLTDHWMLLLGIAFVIVVLYVEGGLVSLFYKDKRELLFRSLSRIRMKVWPKFGLGGNAPVFGGKANE